MASKVRTKDQVVTQVLGYKPQTHVSIEYVESLGDWKTAWDHIHFRGFPGVKMMMQFIWQGCDSILAGPLVLDVARLALLAFRRPNTSATVFVRTALRGFVNCRPPGSRSTPLCQVRTPISSSDPRSSAASR